MIPMKINTTIKTTAGTMNMTQATIIILRNTLEEMVHPQTITQVWTDNTTSAGISKYKIKKQQPRAINMRYFWICNQKTWKTFSLHGTQDKEILPTILQSIILQSIVNVYVLYIYRQIKHHTQSRLSYSIWTCKDVSIKKIPIWNNYARRYPFTKYHNSGETEPGNGPRKDVP